MARQKLEFLPGKEEKRVDCFAFFIGKSGKPGCSALSDIYCLKEKKPCPFRATPEAMARARKKAYRRLTALRLTNRKGV